MKRILVATDFSEHSRHALKHAIELVRNTEHPVRITLLNSYRVQETDPLRVIDLNDELRRQSKAGLEQERQEALKLIKNPHITIDTASHIGSLSNVILQLLQVGEVDLVVLGKDGGAKLASVEAMLKQKKCPFLVTSLR